MNKFRICLQWRNEHFNLGMLLLSVIGKGAMNAPRYRQQHSELLRIFGHWRNELLRDVGNCTMMPVAGLALLRQVRIYWRLDEFHVPVRNSLQNCQQLYEVARIL
jgi:hypothetical protein